MNNTPRSNRLHIAILGRRNVGKSSLINAITNQNIAIVSDVSGTTTDPVSKSMELHPLGPVVIIDTAGLDDEGELGNLRIEKTNEVLRKTNIAILVIDSLDGITNFELDILKELKLKSIPTIGVINKIDIKDFSQEDFEGLRNKINIPLLKVSSQKKEGIEPLKKIIGDNALCLKENNTLVGDLINPGDFVVLVTPIDKAAPKGRLILPQQQTIRDIIDKDAMAIITKEHELKETFDNLRKKPSLVITDSQAFVKVVADTPTDIKMTSFSILFARYKANLVDMIRGIKTLENLKPGSKILIVEGCTHHRQSDDIGTVKIPRWIRQIVGGEVSFEHLSGFSFTQNIESYDLVIHCGGCMLNKQEMQYRMNYSKDKNVNITNYGMLIAYVQGVLPRALELFPEAKIILEDEI